MSNFKLFVETSKRSEIRRFTASTFTEFSKRVSSIFGEEKLKFNYTDSDGDSVTFSTEEEFKIMLKEVTAKMIRIGVSEVGWKKAPRKKERVFPKIFNKFRGFHKFGGCGKRGGRGWFRKARKIANGKKCHCGIVCDGCGKRSWCGKRFKCLKCPDYDLCGRCMKSKDSIHNSEHKFEMKEGKGVSNFQIGPFGISNLANLFGKDKKEEKPKENVKKEVKKKEKEEIKKETKKEEGPYPYQSQLNVLNSMGVGSPELNRKLLDKYKGDIRVVVNDILNQ